MATIFLAFGIVLFFIVGLVSPHIAGKIERKTDRKAGMLKRLANWFWDPITWWLKQSIETSRKVVKTVTEWGKRAHKETPIKDPERGSKKSTKS